jgi:hypothetical protein
MAREFEALEGAGYDRQRLHGREEQGAHPVHVSRPSREGADLAGLGVASLATSPHMQNLDRWRPTAMRSADGFR